MKTSTCSLFLVIGIIALITPSCLPTYQMGVSEVGPAHLEKPIRAENGETVKSIYLSGRYGRTLKDQSFENLIHEQNNFFEGRIHHAWCAENVYYALGVSGYGGTFDVKQIDDFKGKKSYYGIGLQGEIGLSFDYSRMHAKPIGIRISTAKEFGDFSDFRKQAVNSNLIYDLHPTDLFITVGIGSEFTFEAEKFDWGINAGVGWMSSKRDVIPEDLIYPFRSYGQLGLKFSFNPIAIHTTIGYAGANASPFFSCGFTATIYKSGKR